MTRLSRHHVILLHAQLIAATGGAEGIRDESLLDSALESPYSGTSGVEFYPSVPGKAARRWWRTGQVAGVELVLDDEGAVLDPPQALPGGESWQELEWCDCYRSELEPHH